MQISAAERIASQLEGRELGDFELVIAERRPVLRRTGWLWIDLRLRGGDGARSRTPLMTAIISGGGRGVQPWAECRVYPEVTLENGKVIDVRADSIEQALLLALGELIPPGGHLMVDYESSGQEETHRELLMGVPAAATHLGSLMLRAGFDESFKDWYFSEGGHEGPRKLQANKPPDERAKRLALQNHEKELRAFLERRLPKDPDQARVLENAKERARGLLGKFKGARRARRAPQTSRPRRPARPTRD